MKPRTSMVILFLLPASLFYLALFLVPAAWAFYYSAFDWSGFSDTMTFVGAGNFIRLLTEDPVFWRSFGNTLKIIFVGGFFTFSLAFLLAVLLNSGIKGKKVFRALIFMPNVIATIALTTLWAFAIYSPRSGILPNFFKLIGWEAGTKFLWMSPEHVFWSMLIAIVWINVGYFVVLILAGMDGIPLEFYEAAQLGRLSIHYGVWKTPAHLPVGLRHCHWRDDAPADCCSQYRCAPPDEARIPAILGENP